MADNIERAIEAAVSSIKAAFEERDALRAENERLKQLVRQYIDPMDVYPEDEEFLETLRVDAWEDDHK